MKAFAEALKKSPIIFVVLIFYICAGIFAGVYHGFTGSFSSVTGTDPTYAAVSNTVVGQIAVPAGETAVASAASDQDLTGTSGGETTIGADGEVIVNGDTTLPSGTDTLSGEISSGEEQHYYRFKVVTRIHRLHLRTGPGLTEEIIGWLPKGTTGYVITPGTDWSYIKTDDGQIGYSFNGYLELTEIPADEYPEDLKGVTPPVQP